MSTVLIAYLIIGQAFSVASLCMRDVLTSLAARTPIWRVINLTIIFFGWPVLVFLGVLEGVLQRTKRYGSGSAER